MPASTRSRFPNMLLNLPSQKYTPITESLHQLQLRQHGINQSSMLRFDQLAENFDFLVALAWLQGSSLNLT